MNYSANKNVSPSMLINNQDSDNKSVKMSFPTMTRQYSSFVFLVSMKYLKDEEKSKDAVIQIFIGLNNILKQNNIVNVKAWLYHETKDFCFKHQNKI